MDKLKLIEAILGTESAKSETKNCTGGRMEIVILQRGWIVVGNVSRTESEMTICDASVIRKWGTTRGLGEIAINGPTKDTVLDKCGTVRVHPLAVVATMEVEKSKWK